MVNKRKPLNKVHLEHVLEYLEKGIILTCGPFISGEGAILIFKCDQSDEKNKTPEHFVKNDPFYNNGLITDYRFREFNLGTIHKIKEEIIKSI